MTVPATFSAVSIAPAHNNTYTSMMYRKQHVDEPEMMSSPTGLASEFQTASPPQRTNASDNEPVRSLAKYRIPKKESRNDSPSPPKDAQASSSPVQMETNDRGSPPASSTAKPRSPPTRSSNEAANAQPGKKRVSLSQYKENKRLKLSDVEQMSSADVDMRVHPADTISQTLPPKSTPDQSAFAVDGRPAVSVKRENSIKGAVTKSNLSEPGVKKLIKKKVIWADERSQALVQTSFFEIDESEVADMHAFARQCAANMSIAQVEKLLERDLRRQRGAPDANALENDDKPNLPPLPTLIRILLPDALPTPIVKSQERAAQEEREKRVLQALFMRPFLPDTPREPDGDSLGTNASERNEPTTIPLEDNHPPSKPESLSPPRNASEPAPTTSQATPPTESIATSLTSTLSALDNAISPEVAQILARAKGNLASAATVNTPVIPAPIATPTPNALSTLLSAVFNITRPNGIESTNTVAPPANPTFNFPLNLSLSPAVNQLLASALPFGLPPPAMFNNPLAQLPPIAFNAPPVVSAPDQANDLALNSSNTSFVPSSNQRLPGRFNNNNSTNERQIKHFRGGPRGQHHRRGFNNNTRRGFHSNRHNHHKNNNNNNNNNNNSNSGNNNNNRNVFS